MHTDSSLLWVQLGCMTRQTDAHLTASFPGQPVKLGPEG